MAETMLADQIDAERSEAIRRLLAEPLLDAGRDLDGYRLVVRHAGWLPEWFEATCGWPLTVDTAAGFARLAKRGISDGPPRPPRRTRGDAAPFDRRRYELLCQICAYLVRHPVTTINLLADDVATEAQLDTTRHRERVAFVDALRMLIAWGALESTSGEVDAFADSDQANALLTADTARLHRLLVSATSPSTLPPDTVSDPAAATAALAAEPRYAAIDDPTPDAVPSDELRHRWARHHLGRRLHDDPVAYFDDLTDVERDYLGTTSGRRWVRDRVAEAGFELEERAEGLLAVDPDAIATDLTFPAAAGNVHQLALLLVDRLAPTGIDGKRRLVALHPDGLRREVDAVLARFPAWARGSRDDDGPDRLAAAAVDLLVAFGLAAREPDGTVVGRPAILRYRTGEPVVSKWTPSLFDTREELP
jgi:uncharacterized protein (TIGR02678 family)